MDDNSTRKLGLLLTAVAELAFVAYGKEKWVTGDRATRLREHFENVCELLEEANDKIDKHGDGTWEPSDDDSEDADEAG